MIKTWGTTTYQDVKRCALGTVQQHGDRIRIKWHDTERCSSFVGLGGSKADAIDRAIRHAEGVA